MTEKTHGMCDWMKAGGTQEPAAPERKLKELIRDSRGNTLFVEDNTAGGRTYWSDEIGGGVMVWDTSLVSREMLLLALGVEDLAQAVEQAAKQAAKQVTK